MGPSVLINAYAVSPSWGSEQGVGWNWVINIARHCRVFVITEGQWKKEIEEAVWELPQKQNIYFYYLPVSDRIRRMCWNQGDWRFYFHYAIWQRRALRQAKAIMSEHHIDVIHQLNMVGFREPGMLWKIKEIPFVLGPVCGFVPINLTYFSNSPIFVKIKAVVKNLINHLQFRYSPRVRKAFKKADIIITPSAECSELIMSVYNKQSLVIPETGVVKEGENKDTIKKDGDKFNLLWLGKFSDRKKLDIAIRTLSEIGKKSNCFLHIVGSGSEKEISKYHKLADNQGVSRQCIWYGCVEHEKALEMMTWMDALFFTSINEATSTVVLEAIQKHLPVICHDCCGFGPIIDDSIGRKIPVTDNNGSVHLFAKVISELIENRDVLNQMQNNFDKVASPLTYDSKAKRMLDVYENLTLNQ